MSRRTNGRPQLAHPRVILSCHPERRCRRGRTLIGQASRALYIAGHAADAEALRARLRAADPHGYLDLLRACVDFWPAGQDTYYLVGDPEHDWASAQIPPAQRRKRSG